MRDLTRGPIPGHLLAMALPIGAAGIAMFVAVVSVWLQAALSFYLLSRTMHMRLVQ